MSAGSHGSTTRTVWSLRRRRSAAVGSAPSTRTATAATSKRSISASSTAAGQPIDRDDLVLVEQRQASRRAGRRCGRSRARAPPRARRGAGSAAARMRAHTHHSGRVRAVMREDAPARDDERRGLVARSRRARRRLRSRAGRRRRCAGSPRAVARPASPHPTCVAADRLRRASRRRLRGYVVTRRSSAGDVVERGERVARAAVSDVDVAAEPRAGPRRARVCAFWSPRAIATAVA